MFRMLQCLGRELLALEYVHGRIDGSVVLTISSIQANIFAMSTRDKPFRARRDPPTALGLSGPCY